MHYKRWSKVEGKVAGVFMRFGKNEGTGDSLALTRDLHLVPKLPRIIMIIDGRHNLAK